MGWFVGRGGRRGGVGEGEDRLCQTIMNHLDVFWVVGDEQRCASELSLSQVALMLRLQIRSPLYRECKVLFSLLQKLDSVCVAQPSKGLCHDVLQAHTALLNPKTYVLSQKRHPYTEMLSSKTSGDSRSVFLHCGDVSVPDNYRKKH